MEQVKKRPREQRTRRTTCAAETAERKWYFGTLTTIHEGGFGFIEQGPGQRDAFVMKSSVPAELWELGQRLKFYLDPPHKGKAWVAVNVQAAD